MKLWSSIWMPKKKDTISPCGALTPRFLNFFDLVIVGVGSSLGFGISVLIGGLIKNVTGPALVISISLAGFTALIGGLCFAEFGVRFFNVDSAYPYCYLWSRENTAFIFGWALTLEYVAGTASGAKAIIAFIDALTESKISVFLSKVITLDSLNGFPYFDFLSLGIIAVITILIGFGMKDSIIVKKFFTLCNTVLVISIITAGTFRVESKNWCPEGTPDGKDIGGFIPFGILGVAKGAAIAFYGFIGFDTISITGNEVKKRKRNLPLAIIVTILFNLVAYAGIGVVLSLMLPYYKLNPRAAVPFVFQHMEWTSLKWIVAVVTFSGFQTSLFGAVFSLPGIIYAMAKDGLLFHCLGNSHCKLKIPVLASVTGGLTAAAVAGFFSFEKLVNLTVMGALFVYTILAINIVLFRYTSKLENEKNLSEFWSQLGKTDSKISAKAVIQNYFNISGKNPTNLTKKIIFVNLLLFCLSSIGVSIIFNVFHKPLIKCAIEVIVPAIILLFIMFLSVISITCQPKSGGIAPFQVPLVPFLPCLSVFLNIFLMLVFESTTWILFSGWMALGIVPYSIWYGLKYFRKEINENSIYEINKSNMLKLNDSIWKIKSDKKSFYEGAINSVFSDDESNEVNADILRTTCRLEQADVIQKAELVTEEKTKSSGNEVQLNFIYPDNSETDINLPKNDRVHPECVAQIHTEGELPQERVALEIVDNTYNFLSELPKNEAFLSSDKSGEQFQELTISRTECTQEIEALENNSFGSGVSSEDSTSFPNSQPHLENLENLERKVHLSIKAELLNKIKMKNKANEKKECLDDKQNIEETSVEKNCKMKNYNFLDPEYPKKPALSGACSSHEIGQIEGDPENTLFAEPQSHLTSNAKNTEVIDILEAQDAALFLEEQNKLKKFKEKLNQLLKNQINSGTILTKNFVLSKSNVGEYPDIAADVNDKRKENILRNSVKTLNKSQIKGKLEVLLAKGPPKRPSLGSSFNIKIKETDKETEFQKYEEEFLQKRQIFNDVKMRENFIKSSPVLLTNSDKNVLLVNNELPNDVSC